MNIFDHLNGLTYKKTFPDFGLEEVDKSFEPYMINRRISMFETWIPIVELMNEYKIPKEVHYRFLFNLLPQKSVSFKNYLSKKKNDEVAEERKQILMKHFNFGSNDLECALSILTEEQISEICDKYSFGKVK